MLHNTWICQAEILVKIPTPYNAHVMLKQMVNVRFKKSIV